MAWTKTKLARSYPCNTELLRHLRCGRNWTQKQLADRVGYSARLIRKAEAGETISVTTIDELATALTSINLKIYPEDLITCQVSLARSFTEAWYSKQQNMASGIKDFVHADTLFHIAGERSTIPFAGQYRGLVEFSRAAKMFFGIMQVPEGHDYRPDYTYVAQGLEVVVWGKSWIHPVGAPLSTAVPITQRFRFERGKLHSFVDFCSQQRSSCQPIVSAQVEPIAEPIATS